MSIVGHGIDLVETVRIARLLENHAERFLARILTVSERARAATLKDPVAYVAGRFAAKEAILKLMGTGWRGGIAWTDMEILPDDLGLPVVTLSGETRRLADQRGIRHILLSITHTANHAAASAIGLGE